MESRRGLKRGRSPYAPGYCEDSGLVKDCVLAKTQNSYRVARGGSPMRIDNNTTFSHATLPDAQSFGDLSSDFAFDFPSTFDDLVDSVENSCCDGECTAKTCPSCTSCELSCYLPCENPEECASGVCEDLSCAGRSPRPSFVGHYSPLADQHTVEQCGWVGNGENCTAKISSPGQTVQHVRESHIRPQAQVTCHWNDCGLSTDVQHLPNHLWSVHEPASYVCLWFNCEQAFSTHEELDKHFKMVHCHMGCHWAGCEKITLSETELQDHFSNEHIQISQAATGRTQQWHINEQPSTAVSTSPASLDHAGSNSSASTVSLRGLSQESPSRNLPARAGSHDIGDHKSDIAKIMACKWITDSNLGSLCGAVFKDGNKLQDHIRSAHILCLPSSELKCAWQGCNYIQGAKDKSKLARHTYAHSKYCFGTCKTCGQQFSEKTKLRQHEATHKNMKPYACKQCDGRFPTQNALTNHERIHRNEKPLKCDFQLPNGHKCVYTCSDPSNMSTHRKKHLPPKFACSICDKAFCRNDALKRHMNVHNSIKAPPRKRVITDASNAADGYLQAL